MSDSSQPSALIQALLKKVHERTTNIQKAVEEKDFEALEKALKSGWSLPKNTSKDGLEYQDFSIPLRVIALRWVEGWTLLGRHWPWLYQEDVLYASAIKRCCTEIVRLFLEHGRSALDKVGTLPTPMRLTHAALSVSGGTPDIRDEWVIETVRLLASHGVEVHDWDAVQHPALQEEFHHGPREVFLHAYDQDQTLWARAILTHRWKIVEAFIPDETTWLKCPSEIRKGLVHEWKLAAQKNQEALKALQSVANTLLVTWWSQGEWSVEEPADWKIFHEASPTMPVAFWENCAAQDEMGWSWLHDLALCAMEPWSHDVVRVWHQQSPSTLRQALAKEDIAGEWPGHLCLLAWEDEQHVQAEHASPHVIDYIVHRWTKV